MSASAAAGEQAKALPRMKRSGSGSATSLAPIRRRRRGSCTLREYARTGHAGLLKKPMIVSFGYRMTDGGFTLHVIRAARAVGVGSPLTHS